MTYEVRNPKRPKWLPRYHSESDARTVFWLINTLGLLAIGLIIGLAGLVVGETTNLLGTVDPQTGDPEDLYWFILFTLPVVMLIVNLYLIILPKHAWKPIVYKSRNHYLAERTYNELSPRDQSDARDAYLAYYHGSDADDDWRAVNDVWRMTRVALADRQAREAEFLKTPNPYLEDAQHNLEMIQKELA